jgi:signal peptidase I
MNFFKETKSSLPDIIISYVILVIAYYISLLFDLGGLGWFIFKPLREFYPLDWAYFSNAYGHGLIISTIFITNVIAILLTTAYNRKLIKNIYFFIISFIFAYFLSYSLVMVLFVLFELQMNIVWKNSYFDDLNFMEHEPTNRLYYVIVGVICLYSVLLGFTYNNFQNGTIVGESMYPTLIDGDTIKFDKSIRYFQRGDIITTINPENKVQVIKRIVGLEGDEIELIGAKVIIRPQGSSTDKYLLESYLADQQYIFQESKYQKVYLGRLTVPTGSLFILGDNRINSIDSREYGTVSREEVIGVAAVAYSTKDPNNNALRTIKPEFGWSGLERAKYQFLPISPQEEERNELYRKSVKDAQ